MVKTLWANRLPYQHRPADRCPAHINLPDHLDDLPYCWTVWHNDHRSHSGDRHCF